MIVRAVRAALVQYLLFIAWVLLHSNMLCYVIIVIISHVVEYRQHFRIFDNTFIGIKILKKNILNINLILSGFELSSDSIRFPRPCECSQGKLEVDIKSYSLRTTTSKQL